LGRQTPVGGVSAGASRGVRLDPLTLPVRFMASDARADQQLRFVELHRERVVLHRAVRGIAMAVTVPVASFLGVALRIATSEEGSRVSVCLEHRDPGLCVPLATGGGDEVVVEWQLWARVLRLPLLVVDRTGALREPFRRIGSVQFGATAPRRRRQTAIKARRSFLPQRRRRGLMPEPAVAVRAEPELTVPR
jgi:uncharacterized protein DUF6101